MATKAPDPDSLPMRVDARRLAAACGVASVGATLAAILAATLLATPTTFTWSARALSDMGRPGSGVFFLFNGGLIAGALLGAPFVWRLWLAARNRLERAGVACFALALAGSALVGVFFLEHTDYYLETSLHVPAALVFFGLAPVANLLLGAGAMRAGERRWGAFTVAVGVAHLLVWTGWLAVAATVAARPFAWFAVPEFLAAVLFGGWVVVAAGRFLAGRA